MSSLTALNSVVDRLGHAPSVIHLQFWAYGSWDSLVPISMSPNCKLMSPEHYFNDKSAILLHPGTR